MDDSPMMNARSTVQNILPVILRKLLLRIKIGLTPLGLTLLDEILAQRQAGLNAF